jgi:hypothetical protein
MTALLILMVAPILGMDLGSIRSEPNPEHRCDLAIENANTALDAAKDAYSAGDGARLESALAEVGDSVDLAYESLAGEAHRNTKAFKKAELQTGKLLRRLEGFRQLVDFDERAKVDKIHERVSAAHDNLLNGIMKKK